MKTRGEILIFRPLVKHQDKMITAYAKVGCRPLREYEHGKRDAIRRKKYTG